MESTRKRNLGVKAFQQGLIFASGQRRIRLRQEAAEQDSEDRKRRKLYLKDLENRPSTKFAVHFVCKLVLNTKDGFSTSSPWL